MYNYGSIHRFLGIEKDNYISDYPVDVLEWNFGINSSYNDSQIREIELTQDSFRNRGMFTEYEYDKINKSFKSKYPIGSKVLFSLFRKQYDKENDIVFCIAMVDDKPILGAQNIFKKQFGQQLDIDRFQDLENINSLFQNDKYMNFDNEMVSIFIWFSLYLMQKTNKTEIIFDCSETSYCHLTPYIHRNKNYLNYIKNLNFFATHNKIDKTVTIRRNDE